MANARIIAVVLLAGLSLARSSGVARSLAVSTAPYRVVNQFVNTLDQPLAISKDGSVLLGYDKTTVSVVEYNPKGGKFQPSGLKVFTPPANSQITDVVLHHSGKLAVVIANGNKAYTRRKVSGKWVEGAVPLTVSAANSASLAGAATGPGAVLAVAVSIYGNLGPYSGGGASIYKLEQAAANKPYAWVLKTQLSKGDPIWSIVLDDAGKVAAFYTVVPPYPITQPVTNPRVRVYKAGNTALSQWALLNEFKPADATKIYQFGTRIALSGDASTLAFRISGTTNQDINAKGEVQIYTRQASGKYAYSTKIVGTQYLATLGSTIDLSTDGRVIGLGAIVPQQSPDPPGGYFYIYRKNPPANKYVLAYQTTKTFPFGNPVSGLSMDTRGVAMSGDGGVVALRGFTFSRGNGAYAFYVSVITDKRAL